MTRRRQPSRGTLLVVGALGLAWLVSLLTLSPAPQADRALHPIAGVLQYVAVAIAAIVSGLRSRRRGADDVRGAEFRFGDISLGLPEDAGARSFWAGVAAALVAMLANIVFLIVVDVVRGGAGDWLGWLGGGIVVGLLVGSFSAFVVAAIARVRPGSVGR
jgi:hypothetical protein